MEEGSPSVTKSKCGSGCLVIKKKPEGSGGAGRYEVKSERKRAREESSSDGDGGGSDDDDGLMELYRRREEETGAGGDGGGGSIVYKRKGTEAERKRSKLDVYEFDEYDDLTDVETSYFSGIERRMFLELKSGSSSRSDFGSGYAAIKRRKGLGIENSSNGGSGELVKNRCESKIRVPGSIEKKRYGSGDEAIRLQGKNGVLKVMVSNKKKLNGNLVRQDRGEGGKNSFGASMLREMSARKVIVRTPSHRDDRVLGGSRKMDGSEKDKWKPRKVLPVKSNETEDESSEDSDMSGKKLQNKDGMLRKRERNEARDTPSPDRIKGSSTKGRKLKRGSGTEKQLLRERIKNILVSAGWTIDYRPRRNRDYHDAVYINPTGTAFWSIIKAYDAYQKQLEDEGAEDAGDCSSLTPITDDVLSKLTRQTQRKIEKELKRKKRDDARLSKRKKGAIAGKHVSDEDDTDSSDHEKQGGRLSSPKGLERKVRRPFSSSDPSLHGGKSNTIGRCTLLVRNSEKGLASTSDGFVPYKGKRNLLSWLIDAGLVKVNEKVRYMNLKRSRVMLEGWVTRDGIHCGCWKRNLLSWLIDAGLVKVNEKVRYMNLKRSRVMLEGWVTRDGIHCGCCSKILTVSKFEIHAASKIRQPFQNIHLSSGTSLLQCMLEAWNKQDKSQRLGFSEINVKGDDPNDDTCGICGDGGDLICCDGCPSTFHQSCLEIQMLPSGDWRCPHCSCKFCGLVEETAAEETDSSVSLCLCALCQRKYHRSCMQDMDTSPVGSSNPSTSFCTRECQEIFEQLQKLLGVKHELEAGFSWSLIHRTDLEADSSLQGFAQRVEWNAKLAVAQAVMDECFLSIIDRRSGSNLIHNVVYNCGSNFHRLNYSGFYTVILERGDEIISAASIRIHGTQVAEMPFIGTRHVYRRQGMFRQLFSAIESHSRFVVKIFVLSFQTLLSLKVEKLIIPAISELMDTWTTVFGFSALEESHKKEMKSFNMLVFPGTDMLQKQLVESGPSDGEAAACTGVASVKTDTVSPAPGEDIVVGLKNEERKPSIDLSLQNHAASTKHVSVSSNSDGSDEAKQINEGNQGTADSASEMDDKLTLSVLDVKAHDPSEASMEIPEADKAWMSSPSIADARPQPICTEDKDSKIPEVEKTVVSSPSEQLPEVSVEVKNDVAEEAQVDVADTGTGPGPVCSEDKDSKIPEARLPSEQDTEDSEDIKNDVAEEAQVDIAEAGSRSVCTEDKDSGEGCDDQLSVGGTQLDEVATERQIPCEGTGPSMLALEENGEAVSSDKEANGGIQQPSMDTKVGTDNVVDELHDSVNSGSVTDLPVDDQLGSQLDVSSEEFTRTNSPKLEKLTAPVRAPTHDAPSSKIHHPVLDIEHSQISSSVVNVANEAVIEAETSTNGSSSVGVSLAKISE
ncbi:Increased DNA methylation 1-like protein [Drosera capensis]